MQKLLNDLIVVSENDINTVDARKLHTFLESKQQFSHWIKNRIEEYDFTENEDYSTIDKKIYRQTSTEYHISFDMAKELAMVEKNNQGKEARKYFIKCEKELKAKTEELSPAGYLLQQAQISYAQEQELKAINQKIDIVDRKLEILSADMEEEFFTVKGYCNLMGKKVDLSKASILGKRCTNYSNKLEVEIRTVKDSRFGRVNSYHTSILERVFELED